MTDRRITKKRTKKLSCKILEPQKVRRRSSDEPEVFKPGFSGFKQMHEVDDIKSIYKFRKVLGSGSFGTVYAGRYLPTGTPVAIKTISKVKLKQK